MTEFAWPAVAVRTIPGKSITVRSGASGDTNFTTIDSVEKPAPLPASVYAWQQSRRRGKHQTPWGRKQKRGVTRRGCCTTT